MKSSSSAQELNDEKLLRYSRHILLNEIGIDGQARIQHSKVLIVGAGGLGCPAALYLACAGVGQLVIADPDQVELTNLQRQILYNTNDLGQFKADSAGLKLNQANPEVNVVTLNTYLMANQLNKEISQVDLVLDCSDNFKTRYQINQFCIEQRKPLISGSAIRFQGQLACFNFEKNQACYQCLFPNQEASSDEDHCATMGVLAPLTGIIGTLQACEALKHLGQFGAPLFSKLLRYDALTGQFKQSLISQDPQCPACG